MAKDALVAVAGIGAFVAADAALDAALQQQGSSWPSSVVGILALGAAAAHPVAGRRLNAWLGPGAAWLRAGLPFFLAPVIMAPIVVPLPPAEELPRVVLLAGACMVGSVAAAGHAAQRGLGAALSGGAAAVKRLEPTTTVRAAAAATAATRALSSWRVSLAALLAGAALSAGAAAAWPEGGGVAGAAGAMGAEAEAARERRRVVVRTPLFVGASFACYALSPLVTPASLALVLPPTVVAGGLLAAALLAADGGATAEVRRFLDGAGQALLLPVSPAMLSLGLYTYTHAGLLRAAWRPLLAATALAAPLGMLGVAYGGGALGLSAPTVAALIPATSTTGLAMTMNPGGLAPREWVPLGPLLCGVSGMVAWPLLQRAAGLGRSSPVVRGFALGSVSHVAMVAALGAAGEEAAATAAAVGMFLFGVSRSLALQVEPFERLLVRGFAAEGGGGGGGEAAKVACSDISP